MAMVELLDLPHGVLELIAAKVATGFSRYEEGWGAAAASCRHLHNLQISSEYVEAKGLQSLPWLMPRLAYAKALQITVDSSTKDSCATTLLLHEMERLLGSASSNLPRLQVLALELWSSNADHTPLLVAWLSKLLTGASTLQALEHNIYRIPCPPVLSRLPLKHLVLKVDPHFDLTGLLETLGHCERLETLSMDAIRGPHHSQQNTYPELPPMDLRRATRLQHVRLSGFTAQASQKLALPPGCALCLQGYFRPVRCWSEPGVAGQDAVTALSVWPHHQCGPADIAAVQAWPMGLDEFPNLSFLELEGLQLNRELDLGIFARVPRIKVRTRGELAVRIPVGSWELLELEGHVWKASFADLHSFVRSVPVFAFTLPSEHAEFTERLAKACRSASVPFHEQQHAMRVGGCFARYSSSPPLSRQMTKLSTDERYVQSIHFDSAVLWGAWPADPVQSAIERLTPVE